MPSDPDLTQPSTLNMCEWSLIGNWESGAYSLACQILYLDIRWFNWVWQKCTFKDQMIPWSRGWQLLVAFGGKKIMHRFWYQCFWWSRWIQDFCCTNMRWTVVLEYIEDETAVLGNSVVLVQQVHIWKRQLILPGFSLMIMEDSKALLISGIFFKACGQVLFSIACVVNFSPEVLTLRDTVICFLPYSIEPSNV